MNAQYLDDASEAGSTGRLSLKRCNTTPVVIGAGNLRFFLQDLDKGIPLDSAVQRYGFTMAQFEAELAQRVNGARR